METAPCCFVCSKSEMKRLEELESPKAQEKSDDVGGRDSDNDTLVSDEDVAEPKIFDEVEPDSEEKLVEEVKSEAAAECNEEIVQSAAGSASDAVRVGQVSTAALQAYEVKVEIPKKRLRAACARSRRSRDSVCDSPNASNSDIKPDQATQVPTLATRAALEMSKWQKVVKEKWSSCSSAASDMAVQLKEQDFSVTLSSLSHLLMCVCIVVLMMDWADRRSAPA